VTDSVQNRPRRFLSSSSRFQALTEFIHKKDEEIATLNEEIKSYEEKQEDFMNAIRKFELNKVVRREWRSCSD